MTNLDRILKRRDITLLTKVPIVKAMAFPVVMDRCESWTVQKAAKEPPLSNCGVEKTLESPLGSREIKPVNPKRNQPWIFTGRTYAEAEAPVIWAPDGKSWLIGKDPDVGKIEGRRRREWQMVGWHHWLNEHEFKHTLWHGEGLRSLACCRPWGCKELDMTELLNSKCSYLT